MDVARLSYYANMWVLMPVDKKSTILIQGRYILP